MSDIIEADLTWTGKSFESGVQVEIGGGAILRVGALGLSPTRRFAGCALLPGMINGHSHAFQRGLRGRGETFPDGAGSFWTWRDAMYDLVRHMDGEEFYRVCRQAFGEMLAGGVTTVGEFHYLHHSKGTKDFALDRLVLQAAKDVGIRIVLLNAYYRTGGIGQPLDEAQQQFETPGLDIYWDNLDRLAPFLDPAFQSIGVVAHSIRAVGVEDMAALYAGAVRRGWPFHLHIEEQRQEVADSVSSYGHPPMHLINELFESMDRVTGVHCTHTEPEDMGRFLGRGGTVCICPTTEANLGDGIADLVHVTAQGGRVCLGTDSNARISMMEEMRWVEYVQRLARERRGVLRNSDGHLAGPVFEMATANGAHALGLDAGRIAVGGLADFFTLDLAAGQLTGCDQDSLLAGFITGSDASAIADVCVGGWWQTANDLA